jgi:hypothetical protein
MRVKHAKYSRLLKGITFLSLLLFFNLFTLPVRADDAPVTSAGTVTDATPGETSVPIPVTVTGFTDIGQFTLTMMFNTTRVNYVSATTNPSLTGMTVTYYPPVGNTIGKLIFTWTGASNVSLADGSSIADLTFSYVTGTGMLIWAYSSGSVCQYKRYVGASLVTLNDDPKYLFYHNGGISDRGAPITYAPMIEYPVPGALPISITVDDFFDIGALTLYLEYDPDIITYQNSFIPNPAFGSSLLVGNVSGSDGKMWIIMQWFGNPTNLADGATLCTLNFTYSTANGTSCELNWYENGSSCDYSDGSGDVLIDMPTASYYMNGYVGNDANHVDCGIFASATANQMEIRIQPTYAEDGTHNMTNAQFTIKWPVSSGIASITPGSPVDPYDFMAQGAITTDNGYYYQVFATAGDNPITWASGQEITVQTFTYTAPPCPEFEITDDDYVHTVIDGAYYFEINGSNKTGSLYHPSAQQPAPADAGAITGAATVYLSQSGVSYSIPVIANATGYEWNYSGTGATINGATNAVTIDFSSTATGGYLTVKGVNACGEGAESSLWITVLALPSGQDIDIPAGWSGISSYIDAINDSVTVLFEPIISDLTILMGMSQVYWPGQGINTIGTWNTHQGYKIKVNNTVQVTFSGVPDSVKTLNLNNGWNIIPVLNNAPVNVSQLFDPIGSTLIIIKEIAGNNLYWPDQGIYSLVNLMPGKAYMVATNAACSVTFPDYVPGPNKPAFTGEVISDVTPWNKVYPTPNSHSIAIDHNALGAVEPGDVIGIFNAAGRCCGMTEVMDTGSAIGLTAFGDDTMTANLADGLMEDEPMSFRLYRPATLEEFNVIAVFDQQLPEEGFFKTDGLSKISSITLVPSSTEFKDIEDCLTFYPNPTDGVLFFTNRCLRGDVTIEIFNNQGQQVMAEDIFFTEAPQAHRLDLTGLIKGVYVVRVAGGRFTGFEKIVVF